jgi:hypothetical protein
MRDRLAPAQSTPIMKPARIARLEAAIGRARQARAAKVRDNASAPRPATFSPGAKRDA